MNETQAILRKAAERGRAKGLTYEGEVTPQEAYRLLTQGDAKVVDVRARHEYEYIGRITDSRLIEWKFWPSGEVNAGFVDELRKHYSPDDRLLFLCRSGVRSHAAAIAATAAGFKQAYNILEGFEGDLDAGQQRGKVGGWRKAGLPWIQN
jgi:rhodanese-related sulfurtransferase